jgi:hypothetical protein
LAERGGPLAALAATRPGVLPAQPHPAPSRPGVSASMLLLADEVSRALDLTALADVDQGHDGPMSMAAYTGDDGRPLLYVGTAAGRIARNVMRLPGKAEPIPGIGDEAYAGEHWVSARRGEHVVLLQLRGDAQRADQRNVCWLLNLAASRLPR